MKYLVIDTESGSRRPESTLLTANFLIVDEFFCEIDNLYLQVKPESDCLYIVDAQGMAVNKINLVEHDKVAITYKMAKPILFNFLAKHANWTPSKIDGVKIIDRLVPVGHAVLGDIRRITEHLISPGSWEQFCTYHYLDTSVALQLLRAAKKMPMDVDGSLEALAAHFSIAVEGDLHDARTDARINGLVLKAMIKLLQ